MRVWRGKPRRWPALGMALLLVMGLLVPVLASPALAQGFTTDPMVSLLTHYKLVLGDAGTGNLRLQDPLTRAELAVLAVRIMGLESEADLLQGVQVFKDVPGSHWASGAIAVAQRKGYVQGYPDGTFGPKNDVTYAEMLTIFLRLLGKEPTTGSWPINVLIRAMELNINPPGVVLGEVAKKPSIRLHVFQSLGAAVSTVPVTADGKTILQAYVDRTPPQLSVQQLPSVTGNQSITVSGTVVDAVKVTVNGKQVSLLGAAFSTSVNLAPGANEITVEAFDLAGNKAVFSKTVNRSVEVARIEVTGPSQVNAGQTANYNVQAFDRTGLNLGGLGVTARVEGVSGTVTLTEAGIATFKAGDTGGSGQLVFSAGNVSSAVNVKVIGPSAAARRVRVIPPNAQNFIELNQTTTVLVEVTDDAGNRVADDNNRTITLGHSGLSGVTVSPASATTKDGVATFTVKGTVAGTVTLKPAATGLVSSDYGLLVSHPIRVRLVATPTAAEPDSFANVQIRAELIDAAGNSVTNTSTSDVIIRLSVSGADGTLPYSTVTIRRNYPNSAGYDGTYVPGSQNNVVAHITGTVISGHPYSVLPVDVTQRALSLSDARQLLMLGSTGNKTPGTESQFTLMVADANGNLIREGSVAFSVEVTTSNNELRRQGVPDGLEITLGATDFNPVTGVARTTDGVAIINVTYDKSGYVYLKPVVKSSTSSATAMDGSVGAASSSTGLTPVEGKATYKGTPAQIVLVADSPVGSSQKAAALRNTTSASVTLRAYVADSDGWWIPNEPHYITIERTAGDGVTTGGEITNRRTTTGYLEVTVKGTAGTGMDYFTASSGASASTDLGDSNTVKVQVQSARFGATDIVVTRGATYAGGVWSSSGLLDTLQLSDDGLELEMAANEGVAAMKVYRTSSATSTSGSLIWTTEAVDLSTGFAIVHVPRYNDAGTLLLPKGTIYLYTVTTNALGDSVKSPVYGPITVQGTASATITSARYDAATNKVTITGSGFGSGAELDLTRLVIKGPDGDEQPLDAEGSISISSSSMTFTVSDAVAAALEDNAVFYGNVVLNASAGWYVRGSDTALADTNNPVTPFARITRVVYDRSNNRLYLKGYGFASGYTVDVSKIRIYDVDGTGDITLTSSTASGTRKSDNEYQISITSSAVAGDLKDATKFSGSDVLVEITGDGWFKSSSAQQAAQLDPAPVTARLSISGVTYSKSADTLTIKGSGFTDAVLDLSALRGLKISSGATAAIVADGDPTITATTITINLTADSASTLEGLGSGVYLDADDGWLTITADDQELPGEGIDGNLRQFRLF